MSVSILVTTYEDEMAGERSVRREKGKWIIEKGKWIIE